MKITEKQIESFQTLYKKHFGEEITKEEALNRGLKIIRLIEIVLKEKSKLKV